MSAFAHNLMNFSAKILLSKPLILKTGCDILNDEIKKTLDVIREEAEKIETIFLPEQKETLSRNKKDLEQLSKRLLRSRGEIKDELRALEKSKIATIRATTIENFKDVMEDEIGVLPGQEGYRLNEEINSVFERYCAKHSEWTGQVGNSMQIEYERQNELMESLLSQGTGALSKGLKGAKYIGVDAFKKGIFAGRDLLGKLGKTIKFKPWQVTKMATFATKALPVIGAGIDIVSDVIANSKEQKRNREFERTKEDIKKELMSLFAEITKKLNDNEQYFEDFAPDYCELLEQIKNDENSIQAQEQQLKDFKNWAKKVSEADLTFC